MSEEALPTCTVAPYEAIAGRSISRWASTDATSDAVETESTCCTPFNLSPNAPCAQFGSQVRPVTVAPLTKDGGCQFFTQYIVLIGSEDEFEGPFLQVL